MKRYGMFPVARGDDDVDELQLDEHGEFVRLEDVEHVLSAARAALDDATGYANGRWCEWGERAEEVRDRLEKVRELLGVIT